MNIVNFIDGVDGLAAGVCTIAALTFAVIALSLDRNAAGVLAMLTAGAALGYLRHGFHPASIFLGDSGSNLLGYMLAAIAVQGALKTNAVVALVFPLLILAVPILDSSFVIAKRIKYGQPVYLADRWHFHHRFANIGFSQRRTVLYLYGWTMVLAMLALALRFVPYSDDHGNFDLGWSLVIAGFALATVAASIYLVLVLEILKLKRFRQFQLRREHALHGEPPPDPAEVDARVAHELETGEFEVVRPPARAVSARTVHGTVEFIWDDDGHMLVNLEPDDPADPHTFELTGELRDRVVDRAVRGRPHRGRLQGRALRGARPRLRPLREPARRGRGRARRGLVTVSWDRPAQLVDLVDGRAHSRRLHGVGVIAAGVGDDVRDAHRTGDEAPRAIGPRQREPRVAARDGCRRRTPPRRRPSPVPAAGCPGGSSCRGRS